MRHDPGTAHQGRRLSSSSRFVQVFFLSLFSSSQLVFAKEVPTAAPTMAPSITTFPSDYPTVEPTLPGTFELSEMSSSSSVPSMAETPSPTILETPAPTRAPTSNPTLFPTKKPTIVPTTSPTQIAPVTNKVRLPTIGIDIIVSDQEGLSQSEDNLEADITTFVEDMLESKSGVDTFDYVALDFKVIVSSFRRRKLDAGLSLRIGGTVYYGSGPPSREDLASNLRTYFAGWGIYDLENHLRKTGLASARIAAVTIDGDAVKSTTESSRHNAGAKLDQPASEKEETTSPAIIAGLAGGCAFLAAILAFLIWKTRSGKASGTGWHSSDKGGAVTATGQAKDTSTGTETLSPRTTSTHFSPISEEDDDQSIGDSSAAMSVYTSDESVVKPYDTKRLDKVIAMARKHSDLAQERCAI